MNRIAVCPGSFDPATVGHIDIIRRTAQVFDKVIVAVMVNPEKATVFTAEERLDMLRRVLAAEGITNVEADTFNGLLVDYCCKHGASVIVKGLRAVSDFEYEFQMALANRKLCSEIETMFITTALHNQYLSSSVVKQIARFNGDISDFIPESILPEIKSRLCKETDHG